jgi:hypothetical protein
MSIVGGWRRSLRSGAATLSQSRSRDLPFLGPAVLPKGKRLATVSAVLTVGSSLAREGVAWGASGTGKAHGQDGTDRRYELLCAPAPWRQD